MTAQGKEEQGDALRANATSGRRAQLHDAQATSLNAERTEGDDTVSLLTILNALLRARVQLILVPLVITLVVVGVVLLLPRKYTVTSSFQLASGVGPGNRLAGMAQQLGIATSMEDPNQSPLVAAKLLKLDDVLGPVMEEPFVDSASRATGESLAMLLGASADGTIPQQRQRAIQALRSRIRASVDPETQLVELRVTTQQSLLSAELSRRILAQVNEFYLKTKHEQAAAEEKFAEERLAEQQATLSAAENELAAFLARNRQYEGDPRLVIEHDRLMRKIAFAQSVYANMAMTYDQARLEAVRRSSRITLIQKPATPAFPDPRGLATKALLSYLASLVIVAGITTLLALGKPSDGDRERSEFAAHLKGWKARPVRPESEQTN